MDIVLDFADVQAVTAPFLHELLTGVSEIIRAHDGSTLVAFANVDRDITEELELVLERRKRPMAVLRPESVELLHAKPHLVETLEEAQKLLPHFTAPQLADRLSVRPTTVNERLTPLREAGVVAREPDPSGRGGRHRYRPVHPGVLSED